jgi:serine/threonine protein kinase
MPENLSDQPTTDDAAYRPGPASLEGETQTEVPGGQAPGEFAPFSLGRYRVTERLGAGGFGTVYKGYDEELERLVAIKVPHAPLVSSPDVFAAWPAEGKFLASLDHPGIVPVYDVGRAADGRPFLVSKFIEGRDLRTQLRLAAPTRAEAVGIVVRVAEALHYAHQRGLIHRDIKPANILIDAGGRVYVTDFGIALREGDYSSGPVLAGTPLYMSPEQARRAYRRVAARIILRCAEVHSGVRVKARMAAHSKPVGR